MDDIALGVRVERFAYPDGFNALSAIDLQIRTGEFVGILGANGSGKTTLLKVMDGLLKDFTGIVRLAGVDLRQLTSKQIYRKMGLVFQNPDDQLFAATVFEDVAFGPLNMNVSESEVKTRVATALTAVGMESFAAKPIASLSFGEKKRVCIAGLLSMGHEILLLDEPTAGLDPRNEYTMMNLLRKLNRENHITIIMATHSVDLVPVFLTRLCILDRGLIVRIGTPEEVFTDPVIMAGVNLRLPQIAELIYRLKHEDNLPFGKIPLTIGEARTEILNLAASS